MWPLGPERLGGGARAPPAPLPDVPAPRVARELAGDVEPAGDLEDVDGPLLVRAALDAGRREHRERALPAAPAERHVHLRRGIGRAERAELVPSADERSSAVISAEPTPRRRWSARTPTPST